VDPFGAAEPALRTGGVLPESANRRLLLLGVLAVSLALRALLAFSGGQNFWPDEARYDRSRDAIDALFRGDWTDARRALSHPDHILFGVLGLAPAALEHLTHRDPRIPALFFGLFSVASILLVYGLMRRLGESGSASLLAALLLALTTTNLYYSRHLLPYDAAMAFGLGSLYVGFRSPVRPRDSILCGLLSCCAFLTYNGYWLLAGFALLAHATRRPRTAMACLRRSVTAGLAFAAPILAILGVDGGEGGNLLRQWIAFSHTASQGLYAEGWRLPFAYFWHAEHSLAILWAIAFLYAIREIARGSRAEALLLGVGGSVFVYGGLVLTSVVAQRMVVYGRTARQLAPFACILTAYALQRASRGSRRRRVAAAVVLAAAVAQAVVNFFQPLTQVFPPEFRRLAAKAGARSQGQKMLLFAGHIYPAPSPTPPEAGAVLIARRHPLEFLPYQYEGYTPDERAALRAADIRMRLVLVRPSVKSRSR
jgi:hypothetical protein